MEFIAHGAEAAHDPGKGTTDMVHEDAIVTAGLDLVIVTIIVETVETEIVTLKIPRSK